MNLPTIELKEVIGASSPESPALHIPEPLSMTMAELDSYMVLG